MSLLIELSFALWGLYRGFWVLRKVFRWIHLKLEARRIEQEFINRLAAEMRLDR